MSSPPNRSQTGGRAGATARERDRSKSERIWLRRLSEGKDRSPPRSGSAFSSQEGQTITVPESSSKTSDNTSRCKKVMPDECAMNSTEYVVLPQMELDIPRSSVSE
jgi:hypothetical protein